jgi:hypothetical protein
LLRLGPPGPVRRLHVEAGPELPDIRFTLGTLLGPGPTFVRDGARYVSGSGDVTVSDRSGREIVITEMATTGDVRQAASVPEHRAPPTPSYATRSVGLELTPIAEVLRFPRLSGIDDALRASGHDAFPELVPGFGAFLGITWKRWQFRLLADGASMSATSRTSPATVGATMFSVTAEGGYDFLRWRGLTGFALLDLGVRSFSMDGKGPGWNYLGSGTATLGNPTTISLTSELVGASAGFAQFIPIWNHATPLVLSIQGGYTQGFGSSWLSGDDSSSSNRSMPEVPDPHGANLSGPWIRLGFGIAIVN